MSKFPPGHEIDVGISLFTWYTKVPFSLPLETSLADVLILDMIPYQHV
jgi:hypothetical protein